MVKIPDFTALGERDPRPSGMVPNFPANDPRATALQGLGNTLQSVGNSVLADVKEQNDSVDLARAEAYKLEGSLALQNKFEQDGDYATFGQRAPAETSKLINQAGALIRSPRMRERWLAGAQGDAARLNDSIYDHGNVLRRQAETNAWEDSQETFRRVYVDPNTSDADKTKARAEIEGSIQAAEGSGLLTPDQADAARKKYLEDADFSRAKLDAELHPEKYTGRSRGQMASLIAKTAQQYGVPEGIAIGIAQIESGLNPKAKAPTSSASGLFQIIKGTAKQLGLKNVFDAVENADAGLRLTRDNMAGLRRDLGREPTPGEVYIAHFGGFGVAQKLGRASPDTPTSQIFSPEAIRANRSVLEGKTAGEVRAWADRKMADAVKEAGGGDMGAAETPDYVERLSPEDRSVLRNYAETQQNKVDAETRAAVEIATQNAPIAIQNTGTYDGHIPSPEEFSAAYGPREGAQRYSSFQSAMQVGSQVHDFQTMPSGEIQQTVAAAQPVSSGDDAALEQKRYEVLSSAAQQTITAREKDPSGYVQRAFPNVSKAWQDAQQNGDFQPALAATAAAEQQLGIQSMALLPASVATDAADKFKDETLPETDRLSTVTSLMSATSDPTQRKAIFDQMVKAGLPEISQGAFLAWERGDTGAARRLFQAALTDVSKLPGQAPVKPADIDEAIQTNVMDQGQVGDIYYGLTDGSAENFTSAQRDSKLLSNAVTLRVRAGEDVDSASIAAAKDLFGDVQAVNDNNAQILVPTGEDPQPTLDGLNSLLPTVRSTIERNMANDAKGSDKAIVGAITGNYADRVMSEGYFRNSGNGFVFIDPFVGAAVSDENGRPIIFSSKDFAAPAPPADITAPVEQPLSPTGSEADFLEQMRRQVAQ